jgi:hypothetical protein
MMSQADLTILAGYSALASSCINVFIDGMDYFSQKNRIATTT